MIVWLMALFTGLWPQSPMPPYLWHGHEMLFGFVGAAIGGFLLTAVPSWTSKRGFSGRPLFLIVSLWFLGRLVLLLHAELPLWLVAVIDLVYIPALGLMLVPLLLGGKPRHLIFLLFLLILFCANLIFYIALDAGEFTLASKALLMGINTVLLVIAIIGGRIVPAFTLNAARLRDKDIAMQSFPTLDRAAILSLVLVLIIDWLWPATPTAGGIAALAAMLHALRLARWQTRYTFKEPIVWILHIAYAWIVIGLALKAIFWITQSAVAAAWLHALTTGVFATMIMAVMTRAGLGHTGRPLIAPPLIVTAYILITLAAITRVVGPAIPAFYLQTIAASGLLWIGAFILFLIVYTPILSQPRPDGQSG